MENQTKWMPQDGDIVSFVGQFSGYRHIVVWNQKTPTTLSGARFPGELSHMIQYNTIGPEILEPATQEEKDFLLSLMSEEDKEKYLPKNQK